MKFWDALFHAGVIGLMMLWGTTLVISIIKEFFKELKNFMDWYIVYKAHRKRIDE